jgi:Fe-S-cluster-containing dehydrogenase component
MTLKRRDFLKSLAGGAVVAAVPMDLMASETEERKNSHIGLLYDSTLCIGCQVCSNACKKANGMPGVHEGPLPVWENPEDLSSDTMTIIKRYANGTDKQKDREKNGYAFIKRQCLHCIDPACTSACPASALTKNPETGIVSYNIDACIGCRYCQVSCQFNIPKFQWDKAFPRIVKCQLCTHLVSQGRLPACANDCPTGATVFGPMPDLLKEVQRRKSLAIGTFQNYPVSSLASGRTAIHEAKQYIDHVYGEHEIGGTQVLYLSGVPFDRLGLPDLPGKSYASIAEGIQHTIYKGMVAPLALLVGLMVVVSRNKNNDEHQ